MKIQHQTLINYAVIVLTVVFFSCEATMTVQGKQDEQSIQKIPQYELPDPLIRLDGSRVKSLNEWDSKRRPELLKLFADHVYGNVPETDVPVRFETVKEWETFGGSALAREIDMIIGGDDNPVVARILIFLPVGKQEAVGCFVGLNFDGNHTVSADPNITLPEAWVRNKDNTFAENNKASNQGRGVASSRWPVEMILSHGYALATMYYGDIDPDFDDNFQNGVQPLFYETGQTKPSQHQWGSIATWAWALSRVVDYIETESEIDSNRIAVIGHSRLGKTALWAGATDPRFGVVISNNSGCGGAAISRRRHGETVSRINTVFPHWFCDAFTAYNDVEDELPVDQHMLMALMGSRGVYVASATKDQWADPLGEYESLVGATSVFEIHGSPAIAPNQPAPDTPVKFGNVGYHLRTGKHDITEYDWKQYLKFADEVFSE